MNILFISLWYPNRYDAMEGLFVQKHAEAVSLYGNVKVIYVHADKKIKNFEVVVNQHNNLEEILVYYPVYEILKIVKIINFFRAYKKGFDVLKEKKWKPDILHTNVLTRTPFIGYIYKKTTGTPYIITEHWTRLLKSRNQFNSFFRRFLAKLVVKNAEFILPVSTELLEGIQYNNLLVTKYKIIENVVDKYFYELYLPIQENDKKKILNVTCFYEQHKNVFGLLRTIKKISLQRSDFELILIGDGRDFRKTFEYCKSLNFNKGIVRFVGEKTSKEVAETMQNIDFVVQFSNYESAGVVVEEALVSGKPVISTKVGIATDLINHSNGILVDVKDEEQLFNAINYMLDNLNIFNIDKIRENVASKFSYENIGKKIMDVYMQTLQE